MASKVSVETALPEDLCEAALKDEKILSGIVDMTEGEKRSDRQRAASALHLVSEKDPALLVPYGARLCEALHRPEARTRREILAALENIISVDARACDKALSGAEASLYDENSGPARLEAFRFLALYGSTTETRADKVWSLLDEAIQCYHGDPEYQDMLTAITVFAGGKASKAVKKELVGRMEFDAANTRGQLGRRSKEIIKVAKGGK